MPVNFYAPPHFYAKYQVGLPLRYPIYLVFQMRRLPMRLKGLKPIKSFIKTGLHFIKLNSMILFMADTV